MKYAVNQESDMSNQEKQTSYLKSNITKNTVATKGPQRHRNLGNTCYMNALF